MNKNIIQKLKEVKNKYQNEGFYIVGVFGSAARKEDDIFSDIDIAYKIDHKLFSKKYRDGFSKIIKIEDIKNELQSLLKKNVDLVSLNSANKTFLNEIQKEMINV